MNDGKVTMWYIWPSPLEQNVVNVAALSSLHVLKAVIDSLQHTK